MHGAAFRFVSEQVARLGPFASVVEIGARDVNGSVRPLFRDAQYTATDITEGPGVDVVANGATYQPDAPVACVVCCETLEHTSEAAAIVANARRMLAPGGVLIVTCAGPDRKPHSAVDGGHLRDGEFYHNVTSDELRGWLDGMADVQVIHDRGLGDLYGVAKAPTTKVRRK